MEAVILATLAVIACGFCAFCLGVTLGALSGYHLGIKERILVQEHHHFDHGCDGDDGDDFCGNPFAPDTPATNYRDN